MKRQFLYFFSLVLSACSTFSFVGDIFVKNSNGGKVSETKLVAKGNYLMQVLPEGQGAFILDSQENTMTILMGNSKKYIVQELEQGGSDFKFTGNIKLLDGKEELLGLPTRKFLLTEESGNHSIVWATAAVKNDALASLPGLTTSMTEQFEEVFGTDQVLALRIESFNRSDDLIMKMEVVEIVERQVEDVEFLPPEGYEEMVIPRPPLAED
ncbi:DUF4412 domain-containing protein [Cerasicoccus maritimus]|uniref:DUF4412 domain-containing protein n=1 Tax=Cerasicoccus maritimus TaxID=490089 RepID=UPI002852A0F6|nr:DUF4412 domain-containing protein [Cerasicoccus maritimus]